jgi:hypothetical protein
MANRRPTSALGIGVVSLLAIGFPACKTARPGPYESSLPGVFSPGTKPQSSAAAAAPGGLVGHWQSETEQLDIQSSGTVLINGVSYTYAVNGNTLAVQGQNSSASYPFRLDGDKLTVTLNGRDVVYTRIEAPTFAPPISAAMPPPKPAGDETLTNTPTPAPALTPPAGTTPPAPAGVVPELVGKWCYMSNVNANDGGHQTNTCFALNGDGSYWYHSESSSSGQYGGTASATDDQGRWVASGNTLTATSSTGKVTSYTFEQQNHPKTRDPMLIVNGQAFVTYFQKPSWSP